MALQMVPPAAVAAPQTTVPSLRGLAPVAPTAESNAFAGRTASASTAQRAICAAAVAGVALAGQRELRRRRHGELCSCSRCQHRGQLIRMAATDFKPTSWGQVPESKDTISSIPLPFGKVAVDKAMMAYSNFVPRLYNWCKTLGMEKGRMMPSIGFCADENQGYPAIIITKHFGAYPFNHGYLGGILALDRHGPHAAHGEDMVIIHAPHVGYDPQTQTYGYYRRIQVSPGGNQVSTCCGKMAGTLAPYKSEYNTLLGRIRVRIEDDVVYVALSNQVLPLDKTTDPTTDGVFLNFDLIIEPGTLLTPVMQQSASEVFKANPDFAQKVKDIMAAEKAPAEPTWRSLSEPALRKLLEPKMFYYKRSGLDGEANRLERVLVPHMPFLMIGPWEADLTAALIVGQSEFDRAVASVSAEPSYKGKNFLFISGLNIDVSPDPDKEQDFPATTFLPWAAYVQLADGTSRVMEQGELIEALMSVSAENPDAINIEASMKDLFSDKRKPVSVFDSKTKVLREPAVL